MCHVFAGTNHIVGKSEIPKWANHSLILSHAFSWLDLAAIHNNKQWGHSVF